MTQIITLDGPSGSGKGTISRLIANEFGFALLDSGAIYRIAALSALKNNIALDDEAALTELAQCLDIEFKVSETDTVTLLNGEDVSIDIRLESTGMAASKIAPLSDVRAALLARQRAFAQGSGLVADGRDMGTVVFPEAQCKFYLTASAEERARRRVLQLEAAGQTELDYQQILDDIQARDDRDMNRSTAPLKPADDAVQIDSTTLGIEEVVAIIRNTIKGAS